MITHNAAAKSPAILLILPKPGTEVTFSKGMTKIKASENQNATVRKTCPPAELEVLLVMRRVGVGFFELVSIIFSIST
jgi:hypothetical protein